MWNYGTPAGTNKVFQKTASPTVLVSVVTGDGIETWTYDDGSHVEYLFADSPNGMLETGRGEYNTAGTMTQDLTYEPAVIRG